MLIFLLALFHLLNNKSLKKHNLITVSITILLFSFFNGLGVSNNLENEITINTSEILPILITVLGASSAVLCLIMAIFLIKNLLVSIKKISEKKWVYGLSFVSGCIAMFFMIGKVFV